MVASAGLESYLRAVRTGSRLLRDRPADHGSARVSGQQLRWHRARQTRLDQRLAGDDLVSAAYAGLQDTVPRAALLALHARVEGAQPGSWEAPELVQVWLRGCDYVVPRADVAVFTLGASPRDAAQAAALDELATAALDVLGGRPRPTREVHAALGLESIWALRALAVTGRLHIRWDASRIDLLPADRPDVDAEEARVELARRFLIWLGPASSSQFAKWAGVSRADGETTWRALEPELVTVSLDGVARDMLAALPLAAVPPEGVRLLPMGDPLLSTDADRLLPASGDRLPLPPVGPTVTQRLLNSLGGSVLIDGDLVAAWGRLQHKVTLASWRELNRTEVARIEAEAATMAGPIGRDVDIRWL
ncbi:MAG: hypothetical protein QOG87_3595 [Actinomycetota bacterium]|jgi:hypothetical protein